MTKGMRLSEKGKQASFIVCFCDLSVKLVCQICDQNIKSLNIIFSLKEQQKHHFVD